ncbi:MAG TPA: geranylgeranylglyceryl/heptaprenylglyceryl phosphate synthase [Acidobacteriota bacterium]|nr:geranylgeranylglyceryl/heptaprenylglyceryl phosphate synthase [Acidobacteriota bacterium]
MSADWASLLEAARRSGAAHLVLVDPDRTTPARAAALAREARDAGVAGLLFGSSTPLERDATPVVAALRRGFGGPLVLFPGGADQVRGDLDAVLFLSLLSGRDARFLIEAQVAAAPRVLAAGLEPIPTGYLLVGDGASGTVARVTGTAPLRADAPDQVAAHAQAAECLGFALLYLEAGSGARAPVPSSLVRSVSGATRLPVAVGGGIREPGQAAALAAAGARFVVTGTVHEEGMAVAPFTEAIQMPAPALP